MPRTKWILTKHELMKHAARAAQLRAMGVDIDVPPLPLPAPTVDFEVGSDYNLIFNSSPLHVTLATSVHILPRRSGIYLADQVDVTVPFDTSSFDLCYPTGRDDKYWVLRNRSFERAEVLNPHLESGMRLIKGKAISGLLLLFAQGQLPAEYRHGARINVNLTFFDSLGTEYDAQTFVRVHRQAEGICRSKLQTANTGKRSTLYEKAYEEAPRSSVVQKVQSSSSEKSEALSPKPRKEIEMEKQELASTAVRSQSDSIPRRAEPCSAPTSGELYGAMFQEQVMGRGPSSRKPTVNFMEEIARAATEIDAYFKGLRERDAERRARNGSGESLPPPEGSVMAGAAARRSNAP